MRITHLYRYPVKRLAAEPLEQVRRRQGKEGCSQAVDERRASLAIARLAGA